MTYPIVTTKMLEDLGACGSQLFHFRKLFPSGSVEVTPDNLRKYGPDFEIGWLAVHFLSDERRGDFEETVRKRVEHDDTHHESGASSEECPRCRSIRAAQIETLIELWVIPAAAAAERLAVVRTAAAPSEPAPDAAGEETRNDR